MSDVHLLVVNPNTTGSMTALAERGARSVAGPGTHVRGVTSPFDPVSIESHYDEALSVPGLLRAVLDAQSAGPVDGVVVACFGDPGLDAVREVAGGPVVGIAEAAMHTACLLGRSFSVVTTLARTMGRARELAHTYGVASRCAGIHACEIPVLGLESDPHAYATILRSCRTALECDGSDSIVLGCAGMADLALALSADLEAPVVDGVAAGTALVEGLVRQRLTTSRLVEHAPPPAKPMTGWLAPFSR